MQTHHRDWRDSILTKVVASASVVALFLGAAKLVQYENRKFCEEYGWLKNQPEDVKIKHANSYFYRTSINNGYRELVIDGFLSDLRKFD